MACKKSKSYFFCTPAKSKFRLFCTAWGLGTQNLHGPGPAHAELRAKSLQEDEGYIDLRMKCTKEARFARLTHMGLAALRAANPMSVIPSYFIRKSMYSSSSCKLFARDSACAGPGPCKFCVPRPQAVQKSQNLLFAGVQKK